jgi:SNF2 family DNA or RNA helicase
MKISTSDPGGLLQLPARRWANTTQDYDLILSAFQYSLQRSILISSEQDIKCLNDLAVEPFVHQVENLKQFVNNYPQRMMLLDDVGLGKTISAGLILAELIRRRRITNFLVVCPTILLDQWRQELEEKFRFRDLCVGNWQRVRSSLETADPDTLKVITTYNAVVGHRDFFLKRKWDFVVVDEGDYLKTLHTAQGFTPSTRARTFYELVKEGRAEFFLLLTATPLRKNLWDVFNLAEISSQPGVNPIGTPQSFKNTFIADNPRTSKANPTGPAGRVSSSLDRNFSPQSPRGAESSLPGTEGCRRCSPPLGGQTLLT